MAKAKGSDTNIPADWYDDPDPGWDEEWLRRRTKELGPRLEPLVTTVMSNLGCSAAKRDEVRPWLINCLDRYKTRKIVQAPIRKWFEDVRRTAGALADLLYRGPPFPPGSAEEQFTPMYEDDGELQELWTTNDIARLLKMAKAAEALQRNWRKPGAPARFDRDYLIEAVEDGFEIFAAKRGTAKAVCKVVGEVLAFIGERRADDTITGAVNRLRKKGRRRVGLKTTT